MERFQRLANGVAAALLFISFSLLLAALILALGTESEISEDGMEKVRRVAGGRMSERTQSSPLLRTDDESDATIETKAKDEEVDDGMRGEPILITHEEENEVKMNKAVYTAISVACGWAGAVMSLCKPRNSKIRDRKLDDTDGRTDRPTDRQTDRHSVL